MYQSRFDQATKLLFSGIESRRAALGTVVTVALGGAVGAVMAPDGATRRKKKKKKKPALHVVFECPGPATALSQVDGSGRAGQVFAATRSGTLRQIRVGINKIPGSTPGDYLVQLLRTSGSPAVPDHSPLAVLAAVTIPDGTVPDGASTLVASFAGTELAQGIEYAVVVSRPGSNSVRVQVHLSDVCAGVRTQAVGANAFSNTADNDAVVSVLVVQP